MMQANSCKVSQVISMTQRNRRRVVSPIANEGREFLTAMLVFQHSIQEARVKGLLKGNAGCFNRDRRCHFICNSLLADLDHLMLESSSGFDKCHSMPAGIKEWCKNHVW